MKKIIFAAVVAFSLSSVVQAAPAWVSTKLDLVSIFDSTVFIRYDTDKYLVYTGAGATDSTTINRIYATCLAAISNDQYVQAYTDLAAPIGDNTYGFQGIRIREASFTP